MLLWVFLFLFFNLLSVKNDIDMSGKPHAKSSLSVGLFLQGLGYKDWNHEEFEHIHLQHWRLLIQRVDLKKKVFD